MEETDQHDIQAAVVGQVSQEDSQPTESDFNRDTTTFPVPTNNSTYCSYDYKILQNIKCEHYLQENILKVNTGSQKSDSVYDGVISGLQSVKCEEQRQDLNEHGAIIPLMNTEQASMRTCDVNELTEVKLEKKTDPDEYNRNSEETRHWVVCQGGVLKKVKAEHAIGVADILIDEVGSHNVDQTQQGSIIDHAKVECGSQLTVHERTHTVVEPYPCETDATSFTHSNALSMHERTCQDVNCFTCHTCGRSFFNSFGLKMHQRTHTGLKHFSCETRGKSFRQSGALNTHERTHTGDKPFTCETCGKSFAHSSALSAHKRTCQDVNSFTCHTCGRYFVNSLGLKVHQRTHAGVKKFNCETCGKSFVDSAGLKMHQRMHIAMRRFTLSTLM